jgi:hypothetical protein
MSLFENRQAVNLRACEQMVEAVLTHMGVDPAESRLPRSEGAADNEGPSWGLTCGSAHLFVFLTSSPNSEDNYIHVVAPVFRPPDDAGSALWRRLLELNGRVLTCAAFGLRDGEVVVTTDRSTQDLDRGEIEDMIRRIGDYADLYDDTLVQEFGGVRHCDIEK